MRYEMADSRYQINLGHGWAATKDSKNRQPITKNLSSNDVDMTHRERGKAITRVRDHQKDFSIAVWAVNKHLDFVAEHTLSVNTGDQSLNNDIEQAIEEQSTPQNFDICGMHSLQSYTRLKESHACVDGDIFTQKLRTGHIQGIEGDRVFNKDGLENYADKSSRWVHGCHINQTGAITQIAVHRRGTSRNSFFFDRFVKYSNVFHHGYFQRLDQRRGISLMLPAANDLQDVYENKAYGLSRMKVAQMFGAVMKRASLSESGEAPNLANGQFYTELAETDSMEFLQDKTPATEWQNFMDSVIGMGLKALDIPFSFYREDFTNFFGARSALILYIKSCLAKRRNLCQRWLNPWFEWKITQLKALPEFAFLRRLERVPYRWVPMGTPSANPVQEAQALAMRIALGVDTRTRATQEISGGSFSDYVEELSQEQEFMRSFGVDPMSHVSMKESNESQ